MRACVIQDDAIPKSTYSGKRTGRIRQENECLLNTYNESGTLPDTSSLLPPIALTSPQLVERLHFTGEETEMQEVRGLAPKTPGSRPPPPPHPKSRACGMRRSS